jgi:hypothetical protein
MANITQVNLTAGVPTGPAGAVTVSTIDALMADGGQATLGLTTGAAVTTDVPGTLQQYLRGLVKLFGTGFTITNANVNGAVASAASAPVVIATDQATLSVSQDTAKLANSVTGTNLTPKFKNITASASGATTIVALVATKKIRVLAWDLKVNAAVNFKWQSHITPTDLTGLYYCSGQGDGVARAYNPLGYFETVAGEALDINLSSAVAVGGVLTYVEV